MSFCIELELQKFPKHLKLKDSKKAIEHDYVLMGLDLRTDEEYAGVGG